MSNAKLPISKIHMINSTGVSLNERFTAIASKPESVPVRRQSRSRRPNNDLQPVNHAASMANRRLLQQLAGKHKMQLALKLKRRSMRTAGVAGGAVTKRGSLKALRVGANGRPIRTNSLTKIATMKADYIPNANVSSGNRSRRPLRRSNSVSSIVNRLDESRLNVGGAAQRVARRRLERRRGGGNAGNIQRAVSSTRGRSRSRSRGREPLGRGAGAITATRGRSRSRSMSRGRNATTTRNNSNNNNNNINRGGGRSRSRSRNRNNRGGAAAKAALSIKDRLGVRPGDPGDNTSKRGRRRRGGRNRSSSVGRRTVAAGRVQKRRGSISGQGGNNGGGAGAGDNTRVGRARGRPATRNIAGRSRSRTRRGGVGQQQRQESGGQGAVGTRRGRSQQRLQRGGRGATRNNGNQTGARNGQQQRRGNSRRRGSARGGRNLGRTPKPQVNREDLDKELDQYMTTTKSENDMDYLLKN